MIKVWPIISRFIQFSEPEFAFIFKLNSCISLVSIIISLRYIINMKLNLSISSLLWTVCPCFIRKTKSSISIVSIYISHMYMINMKIISICSLSWQLVRVYGQFVLVLLEKLILVYLLYLFISPTRI